MRTLHHAAAVAVALCVTAGAVLGQTKTPHKKKEDMKAFTVDFLKVKAKGRRFCFIVDYSMSMKTKGAVKGAKAITSLRAEMKKTLRKLPLGAQFSIIFFNKKSYFLPEKRWYRGEKDVEVAIRWMYKVPLQLGTDPKGPFTHALTKMKPRPDAIFFLSDGAFAMRADWLAKLNGTKPKTVIHSMLIQGKPYRWARAIQRVKGGKRVGPGVVLMVNQLQRKNPRNFQIKAALIPNMRAIAAHSGGTFRLVGNVRQ